MKTAVLDSKNFAKVAGKNFSEILKDSINQKRNVEISYTLAKWGLNVISAKLI